MFRLINLAVVTGVSVQQWEGLYSRPDGERAITTAVRILQEQEKAMRGETGALGAGGPDGIPDDGTVYSG